MPWLFSVGHNGKNTQTKEEESKMTLAINAKNDQEAMAHIFGLVTALICSDKGRAWIVPIDESDAILGDDTGVQIVGISMECGDVYYALPSIACSLLEMKGVKTGSIKNMSDLFESHISSISKLTYALNVTNNKVKH